MSNRLTYQEASSRLREIQGACLVATRTRRFEDLDRATALALELFSKPDYFADIDPEGQKHLRIVQQFVESEHFTTAAEAAATAARLFESPLRAFTLTIGDPDQD